MKKDYKSRTIIDSFKNALRGFLFCVKNERNMRIHTTVALYVLFFAPFLDVTRGEYALLFITIGFVITSEGFNTAIEKLCDYNCNEYNKIIGITKDISAGAVFLSAISAVCIGVVLLYKPVELMALCKLIFSSWLNIGALFLSLYISLTYIILGPLGIKKIFKKKG